MAIVRELLIRLGFQTDKRAINETNQAITGFKTRFTVAATAATYAFSKVAQFFNQVATATLDAGELAQSLGISLNELKAIQQAASNFRINDTQLGSILSTLNHDLREFQQGFGRLRDAAMLRGLKFDPFAGPVESLKVILKYLQQFENDLDRQKVAADFFGDALAVKVSNLAKNFDQFTESVQQNNEALKDTPDNIEQLLEYERSVNEISKSFQNLFQVIISEIAPALKELAKWLEIVFRLYSSVISLNFDGLKKAGKDGFDYLTKAVEYFGDKVGSTFKQVQDWARPYVEVQALQGASGTVLGADPYAGFNNWANSTFPYVTNSFEINVPAGTTQEQTQYMGEELQRMVEDSIMNTFFQIQNNNPQVE